MARPPSASGASPATIDMVLQEALSLDGGCLVNQGSVPAPPSSGVHLFVMNDRVYTIRPNGSVSLLNGVQSAVTTPVTVANSDTETDIVTYTVPGGEPAAGSVYQLQVWGAYSVAGTSSPTLTFNSYYGGIADGANIASVPAVAAPAGAAGLMFELTALLSFTDPATVQGLIRLRLGTDASTGASSSYLAGTAATAGTPVNPPVTSAADQLFDVSAAWGTKNAGNTLSVLGGYGQRIA